MHPKPTCLFSWHRSMAKPTRSKSTGSKSSLLTGSMLELASMFTQLFDVILHTLYLAHPGPAVAAGWSRSCLRRCALAYAAAEFWGAASPVFRIQGGSSSARLCCVHMYDVACNMHMPCACISRASVWPGELCQNDREDRGCVSACIKCYHLFSPNVLCTISRPLHDERT